MKLDPIRKDMAGRMLKYEEGLRTHPYKCTADKLTIGYGRNLESKGISKETAEQMLEEDIEECWSQALEIFGPISFDDMGHVRQLAIVNMIFQLGKNGFEKFSPTIELMKQRKWAEVAERLKRTKLAIQTPNRVARLITMFRDGVYPY